MTMWLRTMRTEVKVSLVIGVIGCATLVGLVISYVMGAIR